MRLTDATWREVEATGGRRIVAVPLGSLEQHGPHLPLDTDTRIARRLAAHLAEVRADVAVAPALPYGASGEHAGFPGTLLAGHDVLAAFLTELVRSARSAFAGVTFVCAHGGNGPALEEVRRCAAEDGDDVLVWTVRAPGGDAHAGHTETSLLLALEPQAVRMELAEAGRGEPLESIIGRLRAEGVRPVSSNGVLGDPRRATAEEGMVLWRALDEDLAASVEARWPSGGGSG